MRFVALVLVATFALAGCADDASTTSEFVSTSSPTSATTAPKTSSALPAPSELKTEALPAHKGAAFANDSFASGTTGSEESKDSEDWTANCLPFIPCFPPDSVPGDDSHIDNVASEDRDEDYACPPFDPVCQMEMAQKEWERSMR